MDSTYFFKILLLVTEYLVGFACLIYVCFLSLGSIQTFELEQTAQSFDLVAHDNSSLKVPSVTICDSKSYKIYMEDVEEFNQALLREADIGPLELNRQNWTVTNFFNPFFGRCFTYTVIGFQDNLDEAYAVLTFHQNNSYQVYLHEEGWEILIQFDLDLTDKIVFLDIAKESKEGYETYYLQYSTTTSTKVQTKKHKCDETIRMIKLKNCLVGELKKNVADSIWRPNPNISDFDVKEPEKVVERYFQTRNLLHQLYTNSSNPSSEKCTIPCNLTTFTSTIWKGHKNAFALFDYSENDMQYENFFRLILGSDGKTQIATEYIFMNINGLLSAIGGNLGMFLGFSVFSIYQMISNKLRSLL